MASEDASVDPRERHARSQPKRFIADGKGIYVSATILIASIILTATTVGTVFNFKGWVFDEIHANRDFTEEGLGGLEKAIEKLVTVNESMAGDMSEMKDTLKSSAAKRDEILLKVVALEVWKAEAERRLSGLEGR